MALPSFNINQIERNRNKIFRVVFLPDLGKYINLAVTIPRLLSVLPAGISYDILFESLRYLCTVPLTREEAFRVSWRIAGNIDKLKERAVISHWVTQPEDAWAPVQILKVQKGKNNFGTPGFHVTCRVIAGMAAAMVIDKFWNMKVLKLVASKIGFSKRWGKYPLRKPVDVVGLRFAALITSNAMHGKPDFFDVDCTQSMVNWNRKNILKLRLRVDGTSCPVAYRHPCHQCAIGYDQCIAATHPKTYVTKNCTKCDNANAVFDPDNPAEVCLYCIQAAGAENSLALTSSNM